MGMAEILLVWMLHSCEHPSLLPSPFELRVNQKYISIVMSLRFRKPSFKAMSADLINKGL